MNKNHITVGYGSLVAVRREFTMKPIVYQILGYTDLTRNIVSAEHPLGKGLMNRVKGEKVLIDDAQQYYFVEILDVKDPPIINRKIPQ